MKSSFALLITIFIVLLFSLSISQIGLTHTLNSNQQTQEYLYTQAKLHLDFFKSVILDAQSIDCQNELVLDNINFNIKAEFQCIDSHALVDVFVESKTDLFHIRLHERFLKKL